MALECPPKKTIAQKAGDLPEGPQEGEVFSLKILMERYLPPAPGAMWRRSFGGLFVSLLVG
jgi:hypothetical protein